MDCADSIGRLAYMDIEKIRADFPSLKKTFDGKPAIYLDNACVSLRPRSVIEAISSYYTDFGGCARRALHGFGRATAERHERSRAEIAAFFGVKPEETIFTRNATEAINMVARGLGLRSGERVITCELEHNSNLLPWQRLAQTEGITHVRIPLGKNYSIDMEELSGQLAKGARLVSTAHISNVTGATQPVKEICGAAHKAGALVMIDGAQAAGHIPVDVREIEADFYAVSFHKMLGPSGMGALLGKRESLETLLPLLIGGETVTDATYENCSFSPLPWRLEAGLQDYAGAFGAASAVSYISKLGQENIRRREELLGGLLMDRLSRIKGLKLIGNTDWKERAPIATFLIDGVPSDQLAELLDSTENIMVRAGKHCAHPWFNANGLPPALRASAAFYNTEAEIEKFASTVEKLSGTFF